MDLSVGLTTSSSIEMVKWFAHNADGLGLHGVWIGEDIGRPQEIFTVTSLILLKTKRVNVGIGVASPFIRNITTVARAAAALSEISPDRFRLGLGVGGLQDLASMGVKVEKPVESMRKIVETLRGIWKSRNPTTNKELGLENYATRFAPAEIPIFMGVRGLKMLSLAAEIADGLILSGPKQYVTESIKLVREKRAAVGLAKRDFSFVLWVPTIMLSDDRDLELARRVVAIVASDTPDKVLATVDVSLDEVNTIRSILRKGGAKEAARNVSKELIDKFCISGNAEGISEVFRSYTSLGVDEAVFGPPYGSDARRAVSQLAKSWDRT